MKEGEGDSEGGFGLKTPLYEATGTMGIGVVLYALLGAFYPAYIGYGIIAMLIGGWNIAYMVLKYDRFEEMLKSMGVEIDGRFPKVKEKIITDYGYVLRMSLPPGLSTKDIEKHQISIEQYFNHAVKISYDNHNLFIEVYEIELENLVLFPMFVKKKGIEFPIGIEYGGKENTVDLSELETHMMIGGSSGSGKSTVIRTIITWLILSGVNLHLIDLKYGVEFAIFRNSKFVKTFAKTRKEAYQLLCAVDCEVVRRYNMFYDNDCVNIKEYNKKFKVKLPYEVIVIDEFADLQNEKASIELVEEISAKARACGIHLIVATQRPDSEVFKGRIKANCLCVLGLKAKNDVNSRIIIDHNGLEDLKGLGHAIIRTDKEKEIQCYYLDTDTARALVKPTNIDKRKQEEKQEIKDFDFMEGL